MTWKKKQRNVITRHVIAGSGRARRIAVNIVKMQERQLSFPVIVDTLAAPFTMSGRPRSCAFWWVSSTGAALADSDEAVSDVGAPRNLSGYQVPASPVRNAPGIP